MLYIWTRKTWKRTNNKSFRLISEIWIDVYQWRIRGINKKLNQLADHFIKHWILLLWFIWLNHCFLFYYFSLLTFFWKYAKAPWGFCSQMQNVTNQHSNKTFTLTHFLSRRNTTSCIQSSGFWKPHLLKSFICLHQLKDFVWNWTAECHTHTHFFCFVFHFQYLQGHVWTREQPQHQLEHFNQ